MAQKEDIEAQLIELQNAKDAYLQDHRKKVLALKDKYFAKQRKEQAAQLRAQAEAIEAGEDVPATQTIGAK